MKDWESIEEMTKHVLERQHAKAISELYKRKADEMERWSKAIQSGQFKISDEDANRLTDVLLSHLNTIRPTNKKRIVDKHTE